MKAWPRPTRRQRSRAAAPVWLATLLALLAWLSGAAAASAGADASRWDQLATRPFEHLGVEQGLPHPVVMSLAQDGDGFIWAGTQSGLARWDGYRMRAFKLVPSDPASLPGNFIQVLHTDLQGRLWVGTAAAGLAMYRRGEEDFVRYPAGPDGVSHSSVTAMASDAQGGLWVGTADGLDYKAPGAAGFVHYRADPHQAGSLPDNRIRALLLDNQGDLWIGSMSGLARRQRDGGRFSKVLPAGKPDWQDAVLALHQDGAGRIAFGTMTSGLGVIEAGEGGARLLDGAGMAALRSSALLSVTEATPGCWWIASYGGGVFEYTPATGALLQIRHDPLVQASLGHDRSAALLRDRSGLVWVSTERSLDRYNPASLAVRMVFGGASLPEANVTAMLPASDGRLWVAMADQGIDFIEPDGRRLAALRPAPEHAASALPTRVVFALAESAPGTVWIGTHLGLYRTDRAARRVERVALLPQNPYPRISSIVPDGRWLWLASADGLLRYDTGGGATKLYAQGPAGAGGLTDSRAETLLAAPGGKLWVGTRNGLNLLDTHSGAVQQIAFHSGDPNGLPSALVHALALDRQGRLWVATYGGGLSLMTSGPDAGGQPRFRTFNSSNGLSSDAVSSVQVDARGRIWAGTADGVSVVDPDTLQVRALGRADGLTIRNYDAGAITAGGDVLFGGTGGLAVVHAARLGQWSWRPPLVLTAARVGEQRLPAGSLYAGAGGGAALALTVPPRARGFELEFAALDFSAPEENKYAYRLEGYDRAWTETDATRRQAAYTSLPPGDYRLRVRGSNREGVWSEPELALHIHVLPAWYQTWWAYTAAALATALLAWSAFRWRLRALEQERRRLEASVLARTEHLEKLNAIVRSINEQLDFDWLLKTILREATVIQGVESAYALVREDGGQRYAVRATWERDGAAPERAAVDAAQAELRYAAAQDSVSDDIFLMHGASGGGSSGAVLAVRIRIEDQVAGYLVFENHTDRVAFDESDLELLKGLKEHFVSAFQKARALRQIDQARAVAEAATRAKSAFLANISHEIRTPMNAILGFAGLGLGLDLAAKPLEYFSKIGRAGQNLLGIINDLLDFSKIEAGNLELEALPFSLTEVLSQIGDLFSWRAAEKQLDLQIRAAPAVPTELLGDALRLSQVLANLLANALKFTAAGYVQLLVELDDAAPAPADAADAAVRLRFTVEDSGIGISAEQQTRLFQAFSQADTSTTRLYGGTGLGLAISQQLVRCMGGNIDVDSTPGVGSRFSFTASFRRAEAGLAAGADKPALVLDASVQALALIGLEPPPRQAGIGGGAAAAALEGGVRAAPGVRAGPSAAAQRIRGAQVLVVDDNLINQQVASEILQGAGVDVTLAGNGGEALRLLNEYHYDAVLMDIQMPHMDGYQATARIRAQSRHAELPVIAMTAHAVAGYRERCLAMGMNDYVTKPIAPEKLFTTLASWVSNERAAQRQVAATLAAAAAAAAPARPAADATAAADGADQLAGLPGLDVDAALQRLGGNRRLLAQLVIAFGKEYAQAPQQIASAIDDERLGDAQQLAHAIKGASGNLSAMLLMAAAAELEEALIHHNLHALPRLRERFDQACAQLLRGADLLRNGQPVK